MNGGARDGSCSPAQGRLQVFSFVLLFLAASIWVTACGSPRRSEPLRGFHEIEDPRVALGEQVFARQCSTCHPSGEGGLGVSLNNKLYPRWLIRFQVRNGMGPMPSFSSGEIDDDEMDALLDYVIWLRRQR
jgi:mono/diheme cytochrome c family protein